jgi:hypothetical protein
MVSAGTESYVPDIFAMITRPSVDLVDARNWPPMGKRKAGQAVFRQLPAG